MSGLGLPKQKIRDLSLILSSLLFDLNYMRNVLLFHAELQ